MSRDDLIRQWELALMAGTFLTAKHDPSGLSAVWESYRSVLSTAAAENLSGLIKSGEYNINHYRDANPNHTQDYFALEILDPTFSIPGSGVAPNSLTPHSSLDRLVIVSGQEKGWHIFAGDSQQIAQNPHPHPKGGLLKTKARKWSGRRMTSGREIAEILRHAQNDNMGKWKTY